MVSSAIDKMTANVLDAIMLFGDSITQGSWDLSGIGARLSCRSPRFPLIISPWRTCGAHGSEKRLVVYARKLDVINRGLSGYNTEWAIPVFEQVSWAGGFFVIVRVSETAN